MISTREVYQHVKQSEQSSENGYNRTNKTTKTAYEKLGTYNILTTIATTLAAAFAVAVLSLFWFQSQRALNGQSTSALWAEILNKQLATRVVTLCATLIRVTISMQMTIFAAAVAAIVLEGAGVHATQVASVSIIRIVNNGPRSHMANAFQSIRKGSQPVYAIVIAITALNTLALQFTSTLLLSDFDTVQAVLGEQNNDLRYGINSDDSDRSSRLSSTGIDPWTNSPSTYIRFGEYRGTPLSAPDYIDTGSTLRAYVPFTTSDQRSALTQYSGPATVADMRVICFAPNITITNSMENWMRGSEMNLYFNMTLGNINLTDPSTLETAGTSPMTFACGTEATWDPNSTMWGLSMCQVPTGLTVDTVLNRSDASGLYGGSLSYLLLNITGGEEWRDIGVDYPAKGAWEESTSGPWRNIFASQDGHSVGLDVTLCSSTPRPVDYHVELTGTYQSSEIMVHSYNERQLNGYDVGDVRRLLGATYEQYTSEERGILDMKLPTEQLAVSEGKNTNPFTATTIDMNFYQDFRQDSSNIDNRFFPTDDDSADDFMPTMMFSAPGSASASCHATHTAIVMQTLNETGNPALALQALLTVLTQMTYYDALPRYDTVSSAEYAMASAVSIPARWRGFIIVMVLLSVHFASVLSAIAVYLITTRYSLLGGAWQAIAQVISPDTSDVLHRAAELQDKEVKRYFKAVGVEETEMVLQTSMDDEARKEISYRRVVM